jgi:acyl-CoA synthetase (AMP-forming)/AMP-acid ligase II
VLLSSGEAELRDLAFRQITFGGEAASQAVLDAARRIWPRARVSHVYASTEAGDICCVSDGLAGIPQAKFSSNRYSFSTEGELFVSERPTGDLWELRDGRYHFVGRRREMINVGGIKVSPLRVEDVATSIEGVEEARAYAQASPLMGQLVALDYRGTVAERELRRELRARLPKEAWPALIRKVDCIKVTDAGKVDRIDE